MRSDGHAYSSATDFKVDGSGIIKYPAKAHIRRVVEVLGHGQSVIILSGEKKKKYSDSDQPRHFRQDRYFYYITGCNEPDCYVTYDIPKDCLTLWLPKPDPSRVFYDGRGSTPEEAMAKYDIDDARYITTVGEPDERGLSLKLVRAVSGGRAIACWVRRLPSRSSDPAFSPYYSRDLRYAMDRCRAVKDNDEIKLIREANRISSEAHRQVLEKLSHLRAEPEVEGLFLNTCISAGAKEQAYSPIVGSGPNAGILHYQANDEAFEDRQVLLIDASCEWKLYAADITRTMPLNRKNPGHWPSKEAKAIYSAVERVQEACIEMLEPGRRFVDVNWHAIHMTIDALLELGLLKGDHMDIFHQGTVGAFFPHGLGHHLGLEVHDITPTFLAYDSSRPFTNQDFSVSMTTGSSDLKYDIAEAYAAYARTASPFYRGYPHSLEPEHFLEISFVPFTPSILDSLPLEPGNVVTIEPGIYFNKYILDNVFLSNPEHRKFIDTEVLKQYMPVGGVRIEDDILITETGHENLTSAVKGEEMLEVIRRGAN